LYQAGLLTDAQHHALGIGDGTPLSVSRLLDAGVDPPRSPTLSRVSITCLFRKAISTRLKTPVMP
jgi:hypothetical protein